MDSRNTTQSYYRNICKTGRLTAGMSQEAWAEAIGYSVKAVQLCESGEMQPSDDAVMRMADTARMPILVYWHYRQKSQIGVELLPEVEQVSLPQAVIALFNELGEIDDQKLIKKLTKLAADGVIDRYERTEFDKILRILDNIIQAAALLRYADGTAGKYDSSLERNVAHA